MKKPIEQLQEILCTVEGVEKDVKELRLGCNIINSYSWDIWKYITKDRAVNENYWIGNIKANWLTESEIIWNPLTLKHLMIFCESKK